MKSNNYEKFSRRFLKLLMIFIMTMIVSQANAQLNGTSYTINSGAAASSTNFVSWSSFVTFFNANGITGSSTVTVVTDDVANTSVLTMTGNATYPTSSTKTLTIEGSNKILASSYSYDVLNFSGVDYVTIKNLVVRNTANSIYGQCVRFSGGADYNTLSGCILEFSALTSASTSGSAYINFSPSGTSPTSTSTTHNGSYNNITSCTMRCVTTAGAGYNSPGPCYAINDCQGTSYYSNTPSNNTFNNNIIENFYYMAVRNYYTNGEQFLNTDVSRKNSSSSTTTYTSPYIFYSMYTYSTNRSTSINGSNIHDLPYVGASESSSSGYYAYFIGVYAYYNYGNSSNPVQLTGNKFTNIRSYYYAYNFYNYYNYVVNLNNNTIDNIKTYSSSTSYAFYNMYGQDYNMSGNKVINCQWGTGGTGYVTVIYNYNITNSVRSSILFEDNVIENNWSGYQMYAVMNYYYASYKINRNRIVNNNTNTYQGMFYGMYLYYLYNIEFTNNIIADNVGYYGAINVYTYSGNSGYSSQWRQNTVKSIGSTYSSHYAYGYVIQQMYDNDIRFTGNILYMTNHAYAYTHYLYNSSVANFKEHDNNSFYFNFGTQYWCLGTTTYSDFSGLMGSGYAGLGNNYTDPQFKNLATYDYHCNSFETQNNVPTVSNVKIDQSLALRNLVKSDRGAYEGFMDIKINKTDFSVPASVCAGYSTPSNIYVENLFVDTIYNFNVSYTVNGTVKYSQKVTQRILPGAVAKVDFNVAVPLNTAGPAKICIFVDAFDDNLKNDTLTFTTIVKPAPGGGAFTASSKPTKALYQYGKTNDITVVNQPIIYDVNAPRIYSNSTYNSTSGATSGWYAQVQAYTKGGRAISGASFTAPTASSDLEVKFLTSDNTLEDTMVTIVLKVYDNANGCDTSIKRNIFIYPSIDADFKFPSKICNGDAVLFSNTSKVRSGSMEFSWNFGTGIAADTSNAPEPVYQFLKEGTYKVILTAKTMPYGFTFRDTQSVVVSAIPTVMFSKTNACEGKDLTFTNATTPTTANLTWSFGDGSTDKTGVNINATHKYAKAGTYSVSLTASLNGCEAKMTQKVYQFDKPVAAFTKTSGICDNEKFTFTNTSTISSGLLGSFWDFDDNLNVSTNYSPTYSFQKAGLKKVKLVVTSEFGCEDSLVRQVSVKESPKTSFINGPLCSVKSTNFTNTTSAVAGANPTYSWDFGDGSTSMAESPTHDWKGKLGPKTITFKISLDNGCSNTIVKDLVVLTQPTPSFTAADVCSGEDVVFVNNTSWTQGDISYKWDFGDGTTTTTSDPSKKYVTSVTLTPKVTLYAYIAGGCADSITQEITINEAPRTCDFVVKPDYAFGFYGVNVEPMNANGVVGGQNNVDYTWVFEGGGNFRTKDVNAAQGYDFPQDGPYDITMRATMRQTGCMCTATKTFVMNRADAKSLSTIGVAVYPNPASNFVNVLTSSDFGSNITIQLTSMSGQVMKSMNSAAGFTQLNVSNFSNGVYMIQISNGVNVLTRKITIQN